MCGNPQEREVWQESEIRFVHRGLKNVGPVDGS